MKSDRGILSNFDLKDKEFTFKHKTLDLRDSMLLCYYYIRHGQIDGIKDVILKAEPLIKNNAGYFDKALWLWALGEYLNKSNSAEMLQELKESVSAVITCIEQNWPKPMKSWINSGLQEDVYLTNLSLSYGALLSVNNELKSENVVQLMKKIKEFMFKKFMRGSRLGSKISDDAVMGDIGLAAVPFAIVDAGNQILVAAVFEIEKHLMSKGVRLSANDTYYGGCVRESLTLLLSWYYSERGDVAKAKGLLNHVKTTYEKENKLYDIAVETHKEDVLYRYWVDKNGSVDESPLVNILYAIAEQNILLKEKSGGQGAQTNIIHTAEGDGNPYIYEVTERYPRHPEEWETVTIRAITQPYTEDQKLSVSYSVNGTSKGKVEMKPVTTKEGEKIWEAQIGSFKAYDSVSYSFELIENTNRIVSDSYNFVTRKWVKLSDINSIEETADGISIFYSEIAGVNGIPCIKVHGQDDRIKYSFCLVKDCPQSVNSNERHEIKLGKYLLKIDETGTGFEFIDQKGNIIIGSHSTEGFFELLTDGAGIVHKLKINLHMADGEGVFGTGERYSHLDLRGQSVENYVYNQYRDQGLRTYIPIPFIMSSKGYGLYVDTLFHAQFRFGTKLSDLMELEIELDETEQKLDVYVFPGEPKKILRAYSTVVGKPELPPKWSFGPWMSSNNWDSQKEAYKQLELGKKYNIPSTVIVFEQWSDEATFYIFNDAQYDVKDGNTYLEYSDYRFPEWGRWPDPKKIVEDLHKEGLKVILWQAPVMKYMDGIAHAQRDKDERVMLKKGYHVKHKNGEPYHVPYHEWFKRSLIPDFTNPAAKEWWMNKRLYLVQDIGIDGFKSDGGECVYGSDLVFYDGTPGKAMRNGYPNSYIGSYHDFTKKHTNGQGVTFSRAGYTGAHRIPLHWAGDERSTFKAFVCSIKAGLSSAMSGLTFWGWDLAGFNGDIPTAELYMRSTEMAAFCPVMQYHAETKGEFNQDRTPWNIAERTGDENVIAVYKKYADLRMNILPYIYQQAIDCCDTGIPMLRSMFMEYPDDSKCVDMFTQYMFGDSLLVAPVIEEKSTTKDVYFPEGKWLNLFNNEMYEGECFRKVQADIGEIPVYIKENSVIALNLSDELKLCSDVSNDVTKYRNLCFMIFATDSLHYKFKDDLGYEMDLNIVISEQGVNISMKCSNAEIPGTFILRDIDPDTAVFINNSAVETKAMDGNLICIKKH